MKAFMPVVHLMVASFLFYSSLLMVFPFLVDILMDAFCPGQAECNHIIFLLGAQQLVTGLGTAAMAPILGSMSDRCGRKPVFMIILYAGIVPPVLLACSRTKVMLRVWFLVNLVSSILREGGFIPTALAQVADLVDHSRRASVVGRTTGSISAGCLLGTMVALVVKIDQVNFWIAAAFEISAAIYLQLFMVETNPRVLPLPADISQYDFTEELLKKVDLPIQASSFRDTAKLVWTSPRLRTIAIVDFTTSFANAGCHGFLLIYLKAAFQYGKNGYAIIMIVSAVMAVFGQLFLYPALASFMSERAVLCIALTGSAGQYFLYGTAWTRWVPYVAASGSMFLSFVQPAVGTMVSQNLEHSMQGTVQGFMAAVRSTSVITAPLVFTPLAPLSLGDHPVLHLRGSIFVICGTILVGACLVALAVPSPVPLECTKQFQAPTPPDDVIHAQNCENIIQVQALPNANPNRDIGHNDKATAEELQVTPSQPE